MCHVHGVTSTDIKISLPGILDYPAKSDRGRALHVYDKNMFRKSTQNPYFYTTLLPFDFHGRYALSSVLRVIDVFDLVAGPSRNIVHLPMAVLTF